MVIAEYAGLLQLVHKIPSLNPSNSLNLILDNNKILPKVYDKPDITNEVFIDDNNADLLNNDKSNVDCGNDIDENKITGCAVRQHLEIYTAKTLQIVVVCASLVALFFGFIAGYMFSRRFHPPPHYPDVPFIEQHNHLDRYV